MIARSVCLPGSRTLVVGVFPMIRLSATKRLPPLPPGRTQKSRVIRAMRRLLQTGPRAGTFRSRIAPSPCPSLSPFPRTVMSSTPTKSFPPSSPKISGSRCPKFGPRAGSMCTMPWSISGRRIPSGCGERRSTRRSRPQASRILPFATRPTKPRATFCWSTRRAVRQISGPTAWPNSFRLIRTWCSRTNKATISL